MTSRSRLIIVWSLGALLSGASLRAQSPASDVDEAPRRAEVVLGTQSFQLPEGFTIELATVPGLVERPIECDLDETGALYVTESSGSNAPVKEQLETRPHRVLRLTDEDRDGVYDHRSVFADRMMFPEGAMWHDGALWVSAPPSIWRLRDVDGDGVAEERVEWIDAKTLTGCANDLHGPYLGLDGRIYWTKGAFAEQTWERAGREPLVTRAAHVFRARLDASDVEAVLTGGMDNPIGVAFLETGETFVTSTFVQHPAGGRRDGILHALHGGVYGKEHDVLDGHPRTGDVLPVLTHLGPAAPCGLAVLRSAVLGEEFRESLLVTQFNRARVSRHELVREGASFRTIDHDLVVSSNRDFHPTDVLEDADGSVLVVDTGGWYKICCPTSQLYKPDVLGGIYRVRRADAPPIPDARGTSLEWEGASAVDLARRLGDERPFVRERARATLGKRADDATGALAAVLSLERGETARLGAVWTLARIGGEAALRLLRGALADVSPKVRQAAAQALSLHRDLVAAPTMRALLATDALPVARAAAEALGRARDDGSVNELLAALDRDAGRAFEHSVLFALIDIDGDRKPIVDALASGSPARRRGALRVLAASADRELALDAACRAVAEGDDALNDVALELLLATDLASDARRALERAVERERLTPAQVLSSASLARVLARHASSPSIAAFFGRALAEPGASLESRVSALAALAGARLDRAPIAWAREIERALQDDALAPHAIRVLRAVPFAEEDRAGIDRALIARAARDELSAADRLASLAAISSSRRPLEGPLLALALDRLSPTSALVERDAAIAAVLDGRLSDAAERALLERLEKLGPLEMRRLFPRVARLRGELALRAVAALERSPGLLGVERAELEKWLVALPADPAIASLRAVLEEAGADRAKRLDAILAEIRAIGDLADVRRGQEIFGSEKAACSTCHAIGYLGGRLGPDLTRIGQVRGERDLLEAVLFPGASFVRSYEPAVIVCRDGSVHAGVVREEGGDLLVLKSATETARIAREDVLELRASETSVMPEGIDRILGVPELADLLAFLRATRW